MVWLPASLLLLAAAIVIAHAMGISEISITHKFYNNKFSIISL